MLPERVRMIEVVRKVAAALSPNITLGIAIINDNRQQRRLPRRPPASKRGSSDRAPIKAHETNELTIPAGRYLDACGYSSY